jgi:hypothetical protein
MTAFEVIAHGHWVKDVKKTYRDLIPMYPDVTICSCGTFSNAIGMLRSNQFDLNICRLHIVGRPLEAGVEPNISEISYQFEFYESPLKVSAANIYITLSLPHSHGQVDRGLDRAPKAIRMVFEEIRAALRKRALGEELEPSFINVECPGATSIAYSHEFYRAWREQVPSAWYTGVYQVNELPYVSEEEVQRRFDLIMRDITFRASRNVNFIVHYPHISSLESDVNSQGEFNDRFVEFLEFLIELQAEYRGYIKAKETSPALDLDFDIPYEEGMIMLASTVNYRQLSLDKVRWFLDPKLLEPLKDRLKDRVYVMGLFSSIDMVNSVKSFIGSNVRAVAVRSNKYERKYVLGLKITEDELKFIVEKLIERSRLK